MPATRTILGLGLAGALAAGAAAQARPPAQERPCAPTFSVPEGSFQRLDERARNTYVWIDEIEPRFFVSYEPFDMYVLVGQTISPFQADAGRLSRGAFDRIAKAAYNTRRFGPIRVTPASVDDNEAALAFTAGRQRFTLSVLSVDTGGKRGAAAEMRLCWPG